MKKIFSMFAVAALGTLLWMCTKEKPVIEEPEVEPGTPTVVADPEPVAHLAENFESFTAGNNDVYMSMQANSKGWYGVSLQGTLEADVRTRNGNNYVQFSAHRNSITTAILQEFWLISPRLDLTAAAQKTLTFDMVGGYFNANTEFKVYIMDTLNLNMEELTGWRIPTSSDPVTSGYTDWIPSGDIDLSAYSGVKRIGFYYKGTSSTNNSTTYQIDNFIFGGGSISTLSVNPTSLAFAIGGGTESFTVTSNTTWTAVSSNPADFAVSINGNTVTVTASANDGAGRSATVTVKTDDDAVTKVVALSQTGTVTGSLVFSENFDGFTAGQPNGSASGTNIAGSFNNKTQQSGWTGAAVYEAGGTVKLGTAQVLGWIQTPPVNLAGNGGSFIVSVKSMAWNNDATSIKVYVNGTEVTPSPIQGLNNNSSYTLKEYSFSLSGGTAATTIKFEGQQAAGGRFFLEDLEIYQ